MNLTLVEWLELLTSKHSALSRWVNNNKGTPRPCLKAALLVNPQQVLYHILMEYSNYYGIPFNSVGIMAY